MIAPIAACRSFFWAVILLVLLALPALAEPVPPVTTAPLPTPVKFLFTGYVQGRYSDLVGDHFPGTFEIKRAFVNLRVDVDEHISANIMASGAPTTSVPEAYGEYRFNPNFKGRLGLCRIPFGYELPLSSSRLITLERSQVVNSMLAKDFTFDRGVFAYLTPVAKPFALSVAVTNGATTATPADTNNHKNIVANLAYNFPIGQAGASLYTGDGPTNQPMLRYGLNLQLATKGGFTLISEALAGEGTIVNPDTVFAPVTTVPVYIDTEAWGAYLTLAYQKPTTALQPYLRLDTFDSGTDGNFNRATVGLNYYLRDGSKVTAEYQAISDDQTPATESLDSFFGVQYQVSF